MKSTLPAFFSLFALLALIALLSPPALLQAAFKEPIVNLTITNRPLGEVLDTISRDTGVQFQLDPNWRELPVSAAIKGLPLEKALKRLLRSLNHSIIWQSEKAITIMVLGEAEPGRGGNAISFAAPPQEEPPEPEPFVAEELEEAESGLANEKGGADEGEAPNPPEAASEDDE